MEDELVGTEIRMFPEYGVDLPLWDGAGLIVQDHGWIHANVGFSPALILELVAWCHAWQDMQPVDVVDGKIDPAALELHAARGQALAECARAELLPGLTLVYRP